jgi:hypothetical protein
MIRIYIPFENIVGEIVSQQLHGSYVKYNRGGFEITEYLTADDYEILDDLFFEHDEEDE